MWDPDREGPEPIRLTTIILDAAELDDGRCTASSWREPVKTRKPTYEHHFGPGGFNRCIGPAGHRNSTHKDEWGNVFRLLPRFRLLHNEAPERTR